MKNYTSVCLPERNKNTLPVSIETGHVITIATLLTIEKINWEQPKMCERQIVACLYNGIAHSNQNS